MASATKDWYLGDLEFQKIPVQEFEPQTLNVLLTVDEGSKIEIVTKVSGGVCHSLSWYRRGDRYPGSKLYARTWTPEDPRSHLNTNHHHNHHSHHQHQPQLPLARCYGSNNSNHSTDSAIDNNSLNDAVTASSATASAVASTTQTCHELFNEMHQQNAL
ncbi:hypothetical protein EVAR_71109_1 [Eumeta japonica]|uniref:Uncharacterized protein n=1 Tax=Eumeta variegata TaxID=151549 RepID=A0A4C1SED2_EUMVA|nr:hypothetical protein EVAR_71109_1 [Eumeta japonica]